MNIQRALTASDVLCVGVCERKRNQQRVHPNLANPKFISEYAIADDGDYAFFHFISTFSIGIFCP